MKVSQKNWIGKSQGEEVDFAITGKDEKLRIYTTRPDTLFGVTYMVVSSEHPMIDKYQAEIEIGMISWYIVRCYGVIERDKWFEFSDFVKWANGTLFDKAGGQYGYANADGTLMTNQWTYDWEGKYCLRQGNGVALYQQNKLMSLIRVIK